MTGGQSPSQILYTQELELKQEQDLLSQEVARHDVRRKSQKSHHKLHERTEIYEATTDLKGKSSAWRQTSAQSE